MGCWESIAVWYQIFPEEARLHPFIMYTSKQLNYWQALQMIRCIGADSLLKCMTHHCDANDFFLSIAENPIACHCVLSSSGWGCTIDCISATPEFDYWFGTWSHMWVSIVHNSREANAPNWSALRALPLILLFQTVERGKGRRNGKWDSVERKKFDLQSLQDWSNLSW